MNRPFMTDTPETLIEVHQLTKDYRAREVFFDTRGHTVRALDRVDLSIIRGETLGLVGESGCGKSTLARIILGLEPGTSGTVRYRGKELDAMDRQSLMAFRRQVQMVFQDPSSSLNPKKTVFQTLCEPLKIHRLCPRGKYTEEVARLLGEVGLDPQAMHRYPHQFSGGQRQRIGLARALATRPGLIVADEPTSALDVSIQAQIINLLLDLREKLGLSFLFISHDLPVVQFVSHRVAVMYRGQIVEIMGSRAFLADTGGPHHPYTEYLISAVPLPVPGLSLREKNRGKSGLAALQAREDTKTRSLAPARGCAFYPLCPKRTSECVDNRPGPQKISRGHVIWCDKV